MIQKNNIKCQKKYKSIQRYVYIIQYICHKKKNEYCIYFESIYKYITYTIGMCQLLKNYLGYKFQKKKISIYSYIT